MFDHIGLHVSNFPVMRQFLVNALAPLGVAITSEGEGWAMIGPKGPGQLWFGKGTPVARPIHIAFAAANHAQVRAFHAAALAAGGKDNGAPGYRPQYHENYYGAFVIAPEGHNFEAVCHMPMIG